MVLEKRDSHMQKSDPSYTIYKKKTSKWIKDLNSRSDIITLTEVDLYVDSKKESKKQFQRNRIE